MMDPTIVGVQYMYILVGCMNNDNTRELKAKM